MAICVTRRQALLTTAFTTNRWIWSDAFLRRPTPPLSSFSRHHSILSTPAARSYSTQRVRYISFLEFILVPERKALDIEQFGQDRKMLSQPGIPFVVPFLNRVAIYHDLRERYIGLQQSDNVRSFFETGDVFLASYSVPAPYADHILLPVDNSWYQSGSNSKSPMAEDTSSSINNNKSNNTQTNLDASSPYTLHASDDNPGTKLVTCLLKGENYPTWRRAMTNALQAKNKFGFVDGSITRPAPGSKEDYPWMQCNSMVLSWIFNSMHPMLLDDVGFFMTAQELWNDLAERFSQGNVPQIHQLKTELMNTLQQGMTISAYYTKLKGIWDELSTYIQIPPCTCGSAKALAVEREKEKVHQFLMGLNEKYKNVRSQILNTNPLPSLSRVYAQVAQEERRQLIIETPISCFDGAAFTANIFRKFNNNYKSTTPSNCDSLTIVCEHCKKAGHTKEICCELHGYPEWWDKMKKLSNPKIVNNVQHMKKPTRNNMGPRARLTDEQYANIISVVKMSNL